MSASVDYWEDQEVVTIETPENLELRLPLAGIGPRFLALFIDMAIQGIASFLLMFASFMLLGIFAGIEGQADEFLFKMIFIIALITMLAIYLGYPFFFELLWNGQTPGKRWIGIRVVNKDGLPLGIKEVALRNLFRMVDYFPSYGFVGLVSFLGTKHQQRIGDVVAATVVVREFNNRVPFHWPGGTGQATYPNAGEGIITPKLSYAIGTYLSRCIMFPDHLRLELSGEIIRQCGYNPNQMLLRDREGYLASLMATRTGGF